MRDTMLRQQRDYALFRSYQAALKEKSFNTQKETIDYVLASPAPQWFVSREFCAAVISSRLRGRDHYKMSRTKRRKFDALYSLYLEMRDEPENRHLCHQDLCEKLVSTSAPRWFLSYETASKIIWKHVNLRNDEMAKRYAR